MPCCWAPLRSVVYPCPPQVFIHIDKISWSLFQAGVSVLSGSPCQMLQSLNRLGSPTLDCILGCLRSACTGQLMSGQNPSGMSQQCWVERNDLNLDLLTTSFPNAAQDAFGLPCCKGTLLAYGLTWSPLVPSGVFLQSLFPADHPSSCSDAWGYFSLGAGLCISFCWTS